MGWSARMELCSVLLTAYVTGPVPVLAAITGRPCVALLRVRLDGKLQWSRSIWPLDRDAILVHCLQYDQYPTRDPTRGIPSASERHSHKCRRLVIKSRLLVRM
jgi:hypothetical protein